MMTMTEEEDKIKAQQILDAMPEPPDGIDIVKCEKTYHPHMYMITPKHLEKSTGIYLNIEEAERGGAKCGWKGCELPYSEHESNMTVFLRVPQTQDLNNVEGLHKYLLKVKEMDIGIEGFAFYDRSKGQ